MLESFSFDALACRRTAESADATVEAALCHSWGDPTLGAE